MPQVLMQVPDRITTDISIIKEWSEVRNNLIRIGYDVVVLPSMIHQDINLSKQALVFEDKALVSVFFNDSHSAVREVQIADWLENHGYSTDNHYSTFCGEADTLIDSNLVWYGFGRESNFIFKKWLDKLFDESIYTIRPLQMHNEHLAVQPPISYLNQCFCPLSNGKLMWYPDAFGQHSQSIIRTWFTDRIEVTTADMLAMSCTAIVRGQNMIIPTVSNHLKRLLTEFGFNVIEQDMPMLVDKGIGCKSLIINVNE